jgi:Protein kinase domain
MSTDPLDTPTTALGGQYTIERELGRGGMATVHLARDLRHHRDVALKMLRPGLGVALGPERFRREITLAAGLQHPHILSVYDSGETATGELWFTMMYVDGESLRDRIRREHQLPLEDAVPPNAGGVQPVSPGERGPGTVGEIADQYYAAYYSTQEASGRRSKKEARNPMKATDFRESGKRDSNPRPQPWQGCALPTELFPHYQTPAVEHP